MPARGDVATPDSIPPRRIHGVTRLPPGADSLITFSLVPFVLGLSGPFRRQGKLTLIMSRYLDTHTRYNQII